jgi:hypothetical protein
MNELQAAEPSEDAMELAVKIHASAKDIADDFECNDDELDDPDATRTLADKIYSDTAALIESALQKVREECADRCEAEFRLMVANDDIDGIAAIQKLRDKQVKQLRAAITGAK